MLTFRTRLGSSSSCNTNDVKNRCSEGFACINIMAPVILGQTSVYKNLCNFNRKLIYFIVQVSRSTFFVLQKGESKNKLLKLDFGKYTYRLKLNLL